MENILFSANMVLPLFLLMGVGFLARKLHMLNEVTVNAINNLVFHIFLPILLCKNIMNANMDAFADGHAFWYIAIATIVLFLLLFMIIPRIEKDRRKCGVLIQAIGRSNYAFFGVPLILSIFPDSDCSIASLLVAVTIPIYNIMSVIALVVFGEGKSAFKPVLKKILTNPLIIGCAIGLILLKLSLPIPVAINRAISDLAQIAAPLALFSLGGSFEFAKIGTNFKQLTIGVMGKLVLSPLIFLSIAVFLGFRKVELASIMVAFAAPTAVNSYTMAQQMNGDAELAAQQVVMSTAFSLFTNFLIIFLFKQFGYF